MIHFINIWILFSKVLPSLTISNAESTGTGVNNMDASYDVIHSPLSDLMFIIFSINCLVFSTWYFVALGFSLVALLYCMSLSLYWTLEVLMECSIHLYLEFLELWDISRCREEFLVCFMINVLLSSLAVWSFCSCLSWIFYQWLVRLRMF